MVFGFAMATGSTTRDLSIMRETIKKEERQRSKGPKETLSYSHHPKFEGPPIPLTTSNAEFGRGCDIAVKDGVVKKTTSSVKKEFYSDTPMPLTLLQLNAKKSELEEEEAAKFKTTFNEARKGAQFGDIGYFEPEDVNLGVPQHGRTAKCKDDFFTP
uniref:Uncharacterized protein n=1 Tax=Palpitomonas bilix TaxID=652834 RepID=A0A7S3GHK4_9EUKA|mmetsp:Transcript_49894/g.128389  ORF Transcript_49894/g.128389 Transcript_49894/m.128389 type:complete len:157 (+) Transcript_49894:283-753(+)